ncbi:hypothetical protein D3C79_961490 [compost metagenome]
MATVQAYNEIRFTGECFVGTQALLHLWRSPPGERCHLQQIGCLLARQRHRIGQCLEPLTVKTRQLLIGFRVQLHLLINLLF